MGCSLCGPAFYRLWNCSKACQPLCQWTHAVWWAGLSALRLKTFTTTLHQAFEALLWTISPLPCQHPTMDISPESILRCFCWYAQDWGCKLGELFSEDMKGSPCKDFKWGVPLSFCPPWRAMPFTVNYPHKTLQHLVKKSFPACDRSTEPFRATCQREKVVASRKGGRKGSCLGVTRREEVSGDMQAAHMQPGMCHSSMLSPGCIDEGRWGCTQTVVSQLHSRMQQRSLQPHRKPTCKHPTATNPSALGSEFGPKHL